MLRSRERWVIIDPKPQVGDRHAEVFAFLDGPPLSELPDQRPAAAREYVSRLTAVYSQGAGLDRDRLVAWLRIRALAAALELEASHREWAAQLFRLVDALG